MISVLIQCFDRQALLDQTLPMWLKQEGVDYEICLAIGPNIKVPEKWDMPAIRMVRIPSVKMGYAYNCLLNIAKGDILLITQCDMQPRSTTQLKRMLDMMRDDNMVSERHFTQHPFDKDVMIRAPGIYLQCLMVRTKDVKAVGGWAEVYDCPAVAAHEDADMIARLFKHGVNLDFLCTPQDYGVHHLWHERPDYERDTMLRHRVANGFRIYQERNGKDNVVAMYTRQLARNLTRTRRIYGPERV